MTHLVLALAIGVVTVQSASARLAGTWVAELKGAAFMRLELRTVDGRLIGALGTGDIHMDATGVVDEAKPVPATLTPIANITVARDTISFSRVEGNDVERFSVRVTGTNTAELTFHVSEEDLEELKDAGVPAPKPIPLRKLR
jgi:hypothetical protein